MYEILINKNKDIKEIILLENGRVVEYYKDEDDENLRKEGNIYIGEIKDVIKGMQSAFIDIGTEKNGFIHLKDILPKVDEVKEKIDTSVDINDIVKQGDKLLVQVKKDSTDIKGARVSTHINLPGKYIALMPETDIITVSQKIEDKKEQERLKKIVKENLNSANGAVIRTSAAGKQKEIIEDIKRLEDKWKEIKDKFEKNPKKSVQLVKEVNTIVNKMVIDLPENTIDKIVINDENEYQKMLNSLKQNVFLKDINIVFVKENLCSKYDIENEISKIDKRKIWLNCGGFITIDKTEALTAIDVNTGKYTGNKDLNETVYKVNKEATIEIAKQIRLRDIGGIIIIDYIDMYEKDYEIKIKKLLEEELKKDRSKTQIEGFTKLKLMEMTRKHICSHK